MLKVLFNFLFLPFTLIADDNDECIYLIENSDYKKIAHIGYDWGYNKREIMATIKDAIKRDIDNIEDDTIKDYFKGLISHDIEQLRRAEFWAHKSNKKRITKSDVIKYLNGYKYKHYKRGDNYWTTCAPYIDNCIKTLKGGY